MQNTMDVYRSRTPVYLVKGLGGELSYYASMVVNIQ
jgi:hypothetical protein